LPCGGKLSENIGVICGWKMNVNNRMFIIKKINLKIITKPFVIVAFHWIFTNHYEY